MTADSPLIPGYNQNIKNISLFHRIAVGSNLVGKGLFFASIDFSLEKKENTPCFNFFLKKIRQNSFPFSGSVDKWLQNIV
ncbi:MAG TPA: hypothetical protein DDX68_16895 [Clostridium sp.]|nr:hypothetical protein [Clostridium sp.]